MNFYVLTLFPEMIENGLSHSVIGRALKEEIIRLKAVNIRDFSTSKQKHVDDYPYGGGCGMVMQPQPIYDALKSLNVPAKTKVVYMTPQGRPFNQKIAEEFAKEESLIILCGHYEGVDERIIEEIVTDEISIGDFVLTGGELAAMAVIDAVARLKPGVLGKEESFKEESFADNTLEYPQYTRPPVFMGREVPSVLLSGHHGNVDKWRRQQSLIRTYNKRPDLYEKLDLSKKEKAFMEEYIKATSTQRR
ncbi:MAG: tRNA (guanosine(37)-N1)-methyltransferase TrmD [Lachnospiraceae bacterium]|nr:tRNA (guanosine(37)-N1)-methyltransferase TrmD [Lachnospiraceae bacterium]